MICHHLFKLKHHFKSALGVIPAVMRINYTSSNLALGTTSESIEEAKTSFQRARALIFSLLIINKGCRDFQDLFLFLGFS